MAVKHYDDTASAMCDVHAGEDAYGIWVAGALRPNVTAEQIRAIRASAPSGDWRPIHGRLELVAVCQVNVPGFPVTRARVASGQVYALVAAGTATLARLRAEADDAPIDALIARVDALEAPQREALERHARRRWPGSARSARSAAPSWPRPARRRWTDSAGPASPEAAAVRERVAALMSRTATPTSATSAPRSGRSWPRRATPCPTAGTRSSTVGRPEERDPGLRPGRVGGEGRGPPPHQEAGAGARQDRPDPGVVGLADHPTQDDLAGEIDGPGRRGWR